MIEIDELQREHSELGERVDALRRHL